MQHISRQGGIRFGRETKACSQPIHHRLQSSPHCWRLEGDKNEPLLSVALFMPNAPYPIGYSLSILVVKLKNYFVSFIILFACEWLPHRRLLRSPDLPLQPDQGFDMGPGVYPTPGLLAIRILRLPLPVMPPAKRLCSHLLYCVLNKKPQPGRGLYCYTCRLSV